MTAPGAGRTSGETQARKQSPVRRQDHSPRRFRGIPAGQPYVNAQPWLSNKLQQAVLDSHTSTPFYERDATARLLPFDGTVPASLPACKAGPPPAGLGDHSPRGTIKAVYDSKVLAAAEGRSQLKDAALSPRSTLPAARPPLAASLSSHSLPVWDRRAADSVASTTRPALVRKQMSRKRLQLAAKESTRDLSNHSQNPAAQDSRDISSSQSERPAAEQQRGLPGRTSLATSSRRNQGSPRRSERLACTDTLNHAASVVSYPALRDLHRLQLRLQLYAEGTLPPSHYKALAKHAAAVDDSISARLQCALEQDALEQQAQAPARSSQRSRTSSPSRPASRAWLYGVDFAPVQVPIPVLQAPAPPPRPPARQVSTAKSAAGPASLPAGGSSGSYSFGLDDQVSTAKSAAGSASLPAGGLSGSYSFGLEDLRGQTPRAAQDEQPARPPARHGRREEAVPVLDVAGPLEATPSGALDDQLLSHSTEKRSLRQTGSAASVQVLRLDAGSMASSASDAASCDELGTASSATAESEPPDDLAEEEGQPRQAAAVQPRGSVDDEYAADFEDSPAVVELADPDLAEAPDYAADFEERPEPAAESAEDAYPSPSDAQPSQWAGQKTGTWPDGGEQQGPSQPGNAAHVAQRSRASMPDSAVDTAVWAVEIATVAETPQPPIAAYQSALYRQKSDRPAVQPGVAPAHAPTRAPSTGKPAHSLPDQDTIKPPTTPMRTESMQPPLASTPAAHADLLGLDSIPEVAVRPDAEHVSTPSPASPMADAMEIGARGSRGTSIGSRATSLEYTNRVLLPGLLGSPRGSAPQRQASRVCLDRQGSNASSERSMRRSSMDGRSIGGATAQDLIWAEPALPLTPSGGSLSSAMAVAAASPMRRSSAGSAATQPTPPAAAAAPRHSQGSDSLSRQTSSAIGTEPANGQDAEDHWEAGVRVIAGKYEVVQTVGEGAYGTVMLCRLRGTDQQVAVKEYKIEESDEDVAEVRRTTLREVALLRRLQHPHIIGYIEDFTIDDGRRVFLVMEHVPRTLLNLMESAADDSLRLPRATVRQVISQLVSAIAFLHSSGVIYRDIKPENMLIGADGDIRLCDFGFARWLPSAENAAPPLSDYVGTRWYRPVELLLGAPYSGPDGHPVSASYGAPVDMWAIGCIMAEMVDGEPLFPGDSDIDQLYRIQRLLGPLTPAQQAQFEAHPRHGGVNWNASSNPAEASLRERYVNLLSEDELSFLEQLLCLDPAKRMTAAQSMQHPYLAALASSAFA